MALTYKESANLMTDLDFRGRVKTACLKYADSIMIETASAATRTAQLRWATQTLNQPDVVAQQVQPPVVMDSSVQTAGANITDSALQSAVEATVNKML